MQYQLGIPEPLRDAAARLYDDAFGAKLSIAVRSRERRLALLADNLSLPFAVTATAEDRLAGLAGFHTPQGSLTGGITVGKLIQHLGPAGGLWAAIVFSLYDRRAHESELLMDGIAVDQEMRGMGIGTKLLDELKHYARKNGFSSIRLDVIDTNPAARRLYERQGFVATRTDRFGYLRRLLGFGAATTMAYRLE